MINHKKLFGHFNATTKQYSFTFSSSWIGLSWAVTASASQQLCLLAICILQIRHRGAARPSLAMHVTVSTLLHRPPPPPHYISWKALTHRREKKSFSLLGTIRAFHIVVLVWQIIWPLPTDFTAQNVGVSSLRAPHIKPLLYGSIDGPVVKIETRTLHAPPILKCAILAPSSSRQLLIPLQLRTPSQQEILREKARDHSTTAIA